MFENMNYADDPYWAHKQWYGPEQRQAYENQVMYDRAMQQRHRAEMDAALLIGGAVALGVGLHERKQRKLQRARERYVAQNQPANYQARSQAFHRKSGEVRVGTPAFNKLLADYADVVEFEAGLAQFA